VRARRRSLPDGEVRPARAAVATEVASPADSVRTIVYALGANLAIAIAKTVAAVVTGSSAMLAEAIHSGADSGNQVLLLWGMKRAKRPPSPDYPLGPGKAVFFWSFIVALVLFSVGGLFSLYEGWHKLSHPEPLRHIWIAVGILVFGLAAETVSLRACLHEVNKVRGKRTLWRWFRESRQSELVVIFGEDIAAGLGLVLALIAVLFAASTGNPVWDALGSIAIGVVLIVVAVLLGIEIKALLIGQSAEPETEARIREFLLRQSGVDGVFRILTLQLGASLMVAVKVRMNPVTAKDMIAAMNRAEAATRAEFPEIQWLFFEPDVAD
jgi:cation diffusion facilitator family transporter